MKQLKSLFSVSRVAVGTAMLTVGTLAHAAGEDGGAVAALTAAGTTAIAVATAALAVVVGIKVFKYIRQAL